MTIFNVLIYNANEKKFEPYDIMPCLRRLYYDEDKKPSTFEEFKEFIINKGRHMWSARCEYEIILSDWPCQKRFEKWDIYEQIMMNIDIITNLLIKELS